MWLMTPTSTRSILPTKPMSSPPGPCHGRDAEELAVVAREPHRRLPVAVDAHDDVLVDLADEDHLRHLDGVGVAHAQPADELDRHVEAVHVGRDVGPAAVDDDRVQPDVLQEHDVAREVLAQLRVGHRRPAVLDDDRLAVELPDVRERLEQGPDVVLCRPSRRVVRVDGHVLVREVGEEDLGLGAVAGQDDVVLDLLAGDRLRQRGDVVTGSPSPPRRPGRPR